MSKARDLSRGVLSDAISVTVNNTATVAQMSTDANNALLVENSNAAGVSGLRMRGGSGKAAIMYGENNSTDTFSIIPRNDTSKAFTIDSVGNVVVAGNLQIEGSQTVLNTATLSVEDLNITVASGATTNSEANGAGLTVAGAAATLLYTATGDKWAFNKPLDVTGSVTSSGVLTANAGVVVDNITIDGNEIDVSSGNLTLDVAGDIILNADGGDWLFNDGAVTLGSIQNDGNNNLVVMSNTNDKDIKFLGIYNNNTITALTLDMSAAGNAAFSGNVTTGASLISTNAIVDNLLVKTSSGSMLVKTNAGANIARFNNVLTTDLFGSLDVTGSITASGTVDVAGNITVGNNNTIFAENNIRFKAPGASYIDIQAIDQDLIFRTSETTALDTNALRIDGSEGGAATFSSTISSGAITSSGAVSAEDNIYLTDAGTVRGKLLLNASDRDNVELRAESLGSTMKFFTVGTQALLLDASQNATFAGTISSGAITSAGLTSSNSITMSAGNLSLNSTSDGNQAFRYYRADGTLVGQIYPYNNRYNVQTYNNQGLRLKSHGSGQIELEGNVVINEDSADVDFRVESDSNANMLKVDAGSNRVEINSGGNDENNALLVSAGVTHLNGHRFIKAPAWGSWAVNTPYYLFTFYPASNGASGAATIDIGAGGVEHYAVFNLVARNASGTTTVAGYCTGASSSMFNLIGYRDNTDATKVHFYVKPTNNVYFTPTVRISGTGAIARYTSPPSSPVDEDYTYSSATTYNHGLKAGSIHLNDNNNLNFGSSDDVRLYFDGTDSLYITATNGTADKLKTNANYTAIMQANGQQLITALANDAVIINEDSNNHDFRVESDGNANMLFVDGGNSTVTVGSSISNAGAAFLVDYNNTSKFMMGGAGAGISNNVYYNGSAWKSINNSVGGSILQMGTDGSFAFRRGTAAATPSMTYSAYIDGNGNTGLGTTTPANYSNRTTLAVNGVWGGQIDLELGETVRSSWKLDTSQNVYFGTGANDTRLFLQVNDTNIAEFTSSNIIFNEAGNDVDFRVESDGSQHAFFVDGGTNNIGIQTATNWALTGGGSASSSSGVSIDMSYDGTIYAGSAYWAGGLKTGTGFFSDASGDRYKRSSRQVTQIRQSSQGADIKFRSQTSGNAGAVISWHEMADFGRDAVVFNNGGLDQDFRVASDNNANMLFVDAGSEQVKIGSSNVGTYGCLEVKNSDGRHGTGQKSWSIISGTSHPSKSVDGVMAFNTTSAGNQLSIPIVSQGNQHRPCLVELTFVTGEYNMSGSVKAGFVRFAFQSLTSIGSLAVLETQGNVASVSSSGMNLLINFTSAYTSGQSNHEGVMCYYRIMNEQPQYVKMWDATLN